MATAESARNARADLELMLMLARGEAPAASNAIRLQDARERFVTAAREGRALNKHGQRYKPRSIDNIEESLRLHVEPAVGRRRLSDVRRSDAGNRRRPGSRVFREPCARCRQRDPVAVSLGTGPRTRDPRPSRAGTSTSHGCHADEASRLTAEFADLLAALSLEDALPYALALAGYGLGRRAQIVRLRWHEIDLTIGAIEWGVEWEARKYEASRRVVPCVPPLLAMLRRAYLEQGRPPGNQRVCPPRGNNNNRSGLVDPGHLARRVRNVWSAAELQPITLQEARHTAATWLDAAGVPPKVASVLMGHATPQRQPGVAPITLARYTHALPQDIEQARNKLTVYLAAGQGNKSGSSVSGASSLEGSALEDECGLTQAEAA